MGQILHWWATTTEAIRRAIQHSQESLRTLAKHCGTNQKTVAKWKKRSSLVDLPTGPKEPKSTVLSVEDEAIICFSSAYFIAARRLPRRSVADDTPSNAILSAPLCLQRHGISNCLMPRAVARPTQVQGPT